MHDRKRPAQETGIHNLKNKAGDDDLKPSDDLRGMENITR